MDSILNSTKKLSGLTSDYGHYDPDIIMYINSVLLILKQIGVGPTEGFFITGEHETWNEFIPNNPVLREATKGYMGAKVRLQFDPPTSSAHMEALKEIIKEYEWRFNNEVETS